ncbi:GAF domain-containing sensor histidine kinase [Stackebrandtia soli]|uniref:GAF domain-containing sensor histidine kinase n=1 Tax=Stackebrandtia soli TaxID=1892856 RepID=UPI0039E77473
MDERERSDEVLRAVSSAVQAVTSHLSVAEVLSVIVRSARRLAGARYAALGIPDDSGGFAEFIADGVSPKQWDAIGPLPRQHGMLAAMLDVGDVVRLSDVRADPRFEWWPKAHPVLAGFLGVPIRDGDAVVGIIFVANTPGHGEFSADDERVLTLFAAHAAIAMANATLHERSMRLSVVEERTRLARELHDAVSQKLFSLRLTARAAASLVQVDPRGALDQLDQVERLAADAAAELRSVIVELRPAELELHGLAATIRAHVELVGRLHSIRTEVEATDDPAVDAASEVEVLRMVQEAVHNAVRHARPSLITVSLGRCGDEVVVVVTDDGAGFDATEAGSRGLGLQTMRERAEALGGRLSIESGPEGSTVRVVIAGA